HTPEAFLALAQRRVDAVSTTFPRALAALAQTPDTFEIVGPLDVPEYTGIVTRLESTELAREVDAMLTELMESGELQQLREEWFEREFERAEKIEASPGTICRACFSAPPGDAACPSLRSGSRKPRRSGRRSWAISR